jgi:hypothetical protein
MLLNAAQLACKLLAADLSFQYAWLSMTTENKRRQACVKPKHANSNLAKAQNCLRPDRLPSDRGKG